MMHRIHCTIDLRMCASVRDFLVVRRMICSIQTIGGPIGRGDSRSKVGKHSFCFLMLVIQCIQTCILFLSVALMMAS